MNKHICIIPLLIGLVMTAAQAGCSTGEPVYRILRERMVNEQIMARGITDSLVISSMLEVRRHLFVPTRFKMSAYVDSPLPIGSDQTISQPYIVGLMTSSLNLKGVERVLEIGTGSGYQAAVLANIADSVFSIEIIPELAAGAKVLLDTLGYGNVKIREGDGYDGWPGKAPFDAIIVTAAAPRIPQNLIKQLRAGGRLVIPVGGFMQHLNIYEKIEGKLKLIDSSPVRFVPMTGKIRD
jgi:protein-L-isoaspartate(D-aspartate) O-methyltransferase